MYFSRERDAEPDLHQLAARALTTFVACLGALMAVVATTQFFGPLDDPRPPTGRLALGVTLLAMSMVGHRLIQRGRPRSANLLMLLAVAVGAAATAAFVGVGIHGVAVPSITALIVVAGVLSTARAVGLMAIVYAALVLLLAGAEQQGWLPGFKGALALDRTDRAGNLLLIGVAAWIAALLAHRVVAQSLSQAITGSQRLAALLRLGSDWSWEMDADGRLQWLDEAFESRSGQSVAYFLRLDQPGGPQAVRDTEWQAVAEAQRARRPYRARVLSYRCADGNMLCVSTSGEPVSDGHGQFTGWWGVGRNVTDEVLARQARQREQAMLDRLVRMSPDALCVARLDDAKILLANQSFLELAGRDEASVIGSDPIALGLWRNRAEARRLNAALRPSGSVRDLRSEAWSADGRRHDVLITAATFLWDGALVAVITTRDITEAERARRETDAILDRASIGIALVRDRHFVRVNPVYEALYGHLPGSLAGQPTLSVFPDRSSHEAFVEHTEAQLAQGRPIDIEHEVTRSDGQRVLVRVRVGAVDPGRLHEAGTVWVAEDIGPRRAAERELAEAKRRADDASQAKSAFLATMSHEIRTPLNGVLGLARLMQDPKLDDEGRRSHLHHLVDAAEGLAGIVSDVLDLSKIEAGQLQLEAIDFDLRALLQRVFDTFAPLSQERGLAMRQRIDAALPPRVKGDPVRVRQILGNFLGNALKFTDAGQIELEACALDGDRVRLSVRDSGVGIAPGARARLFRPFTQADSSTTRRYGGSGLGLSICRQLAERMGGAVGVDSEPGRGSHFWADLRLPASAGAPEAARPAAAESTPLTGMQLLVAEDNAVNMLIVGSMLRHFGAEVLEAEDGAQAVTLARQHATTLRAVLMDLHMPQMDGLTATRQLRADPLTARLPVIALTAAVLGRDRELAREAGMQEFVPKPFEPADLLRVLEPLRAAPGGA